MKKCPICDQTYTDEGLNFCLSDGGTLQKISDDSPPTVFMNQARVTSPTNWKNAEPPAPAWQNLPSVHNSQYMSPTMKSAGQNQTLPTVSLVMGILSLLLCFCFGGIPLGLGAAITGFLGMNNANKNPQIYGGRGIAIAGMVCGLISIIASILWFVLAAIGKH